MYSADALSISSSSSGDGQSTVHSTIETIESNNRDRIINGREDPFVEKRHGHDEPSSSDDANRHHHAITTVAAIDECAVDDHPQFGASTKGKKASTTGLEWRGRWRKKRRFSLSATFWLPVLLCLYAILKEIKVGEPFLFKYQTEYLNLTREQITGEIYPFTPYSYTISLVPIFLLTDLLLYKPTMIVEVIGQIVFRATLVFGGSVLSQVIGQIFYGMASASEIAFFSYIYARLEKNQYQKLTSWTRAGTMAGRTFGYLFSQFLIMSQLGNLRTLNIIALVMPCLVFVFCVFLPRVHWKVMVGRMLEAKGVEIKASSSATTNQLPKSYAQYGMYRLSKLRSDFCKIYSIGFIRKWSLWWAMTTCMSLQVALFSQTLWGEVASKDVSPYNGLAEASYTATATIAILAMNAFPLDWDKWGELALVIISSIDAGMLFIYSQTDSIYVMYGCYICYRSLYQVMITIAQWNIAKKMVCESYGLVFGTNSFIALIMQSVLTVVVTDRRGLGLHVRHQYLIYSALHMAIAAIFLCSVAATVMAYLCSRREKKTNTVAPTAVVEAVKSSVLDTAASIVNCTEDAKESGKGDDIHDDDNGACPPEKTFRQRIDSLKDTVAWRSFDLSASRRSVAGASANDDKSRLTVEEIRERQHEIADGVDI